MPRGSDVVLPLAPRTAALQATIDHDLPELEKAAMP